MSISVEGMGSREMATVEKVCRRKEEKESIGFWKKDIEKKIEKLLIALNSINRMKKQRSISLTCEVLEHSTQLLEYNVGLIKSGYTSQEQRIDFLKEEIEEDMDSLSIAVDSNDEEKKQRGIFQACKALQHDILELRYEVGLKNRLRTMIDKGLAGFTVLFFLFAGFCFIFKLFGAI